MEIYFLGTGTSQGIPVIGVDHPVCQSKDPRDQRLRSSIWIQDNDTSIVIDSGPDFRQQMLTSKCSRIDGLLYTHEHADHTAGFDDIRPFCFTQGKVDLYGLPRVIDSLKRRFDYAFTTENRYPGAPVVDAHTVAIGQNFNIKSATIIPIGILHGELPILGYRIKDFAYLTDVKTIENDQLEQLKNLDVLVINALRITPHNTHLNLEEALALIDIIQPKKTYLTHISYHMGFHEEVCLHLPSNVSLAYDNLYISI